jgi:hypothetical protein
MNVQVSTMLLMVLLISVVLIALGFGKIIASNDRPARVAEWNAAYAAYVAAVVPAMQKTAVQLGSTGAAFTLEKMPYGFKGATDGLATTKPVAHRWLLAVAPADVYSVVIAVAESGFAANLSLGTSAVSTTVRTPIACTEGYNAGGDCPWAWLAAECKRRSYVNATFARDAALAAAGSCAVGTAACGKCVFDVYVAQRQEFVVFDAAATAWRGAAGWKARPQGFLYPFGVGQQALGGSMGATQQLTLMPLGDPYVAAQNLTKGSMDFGGTVAAQKREGTVMIAAGLCVLLCSAVIVFVARRMVLRAAALRKQAAKEDDEDSDDDRRTAALMSDAQRDGAAAAAAATDRDRIAAEDEDDARRLREMQRDADGSGGESDTAMRARHVAASLAADRPLLVHARLSDTGSDSSRGSSVERRADLLSILRPHNPNRAVNREPAPAAADAYAQQFQVRTPQQVMADAIAQSRGTGAGAAASRQMDARPLASAKSAAELEDARARRKVRRPPARRAAHTPLESDQAARRVVGPAPTSSSDTSDPDL